MTTVVSSRINHNKGAENARRQTDKETGQNVQRLMTTTPRRASLRDHCHVRQLQYDGVETPDGAGDSAVCPRLRFRVDCRRRR